MVLNVDSIFPVTEATEEFFNQSKDKGILTYYVGGDYIGGYFLGYTAEQEVLSYTIPANSVINGIKCTGIVYAARSDSSTMRIRAKEMLTNPNMTSNTAWIIDAVDWTWINSGNEDYYYKDQNGTGTLYQPIANMVSPMILGETYTIGFKMINMAAPSFVVTCGGYNSGVLSVDTQIITTFVCTDPTIPFTVTPTNTARGKIYWASISKGKTNAQVAVRTTDVWYCYSYIDDLNWSEEQTIVVGVIPNTSLTAFYGQQLIIEGY